MFIVFIGGNQSTLYAQQYKSYIKILTGAVDKAPSHSRISHQRLAKQTLPDTKVHLYKPFS